MKYAQQLVLQFCEEIFKKYKENSGGHWQNKILATDNQLNTTKQSIFKELIETLKAIPTDTKASVFLAKTQGAVKTSINKVNREILEHNENNFINRKPGQLKNELMFISHLISLLNTHLLNQPYFNLSEHEEIKNYNETSMSSCLLCYKHAVLIWFLRELHNATADHLSTHQYDLSFTQENLARLQKDCSAIFAILASLGATEDVKIFKFYTGGLKNAAKALENTPAPHDDETFTRKATHALGSFFYSKKTTASSSTDRYDRVSLPQLLEDPKNALPKPKTKIIEATGATPSKTMST